jgi:hypothetical protein
MKRRLARTQITELEKGSRNGEVCVYIENNSVDIIKINPIWGRESISAPVSWLFANGSRIGSEEILGVCLPAFPS